MALKIKYIIAALAIGLSASSCKKDWLNVTPDSEIRSEDQFKTEAGFKDALIGVYIGMTDPALYGKDMTWDMMDLLGQQYAPLTASATLDFDLQNYNYTAVLAVPRTEAVWNKAYNVIANINNALDYIDKNKTVLNPISYSIIKGELLGLRAYLYLDLMRVYGYGNIAGRADLAGKLAVPYVTKFSKEITPQLPYSQTFELVAKDINEALVLLKEDPAYNEPKKDASYYNAVNRDGFFNKREQRMNYYAVKALQARLLQWQGGQQNIAAAAAAAEAVIANAPAKLLTSPGQASTDPVLYPEHLFNLEVAGLESQINSYLDASVATNYKALFMLNQVAEATYETSNPNIGIADIRFNTLLAAQSRGRVSMKLYQAQKNAHRNIIPLIRIPEMYYIAAEHYANTDPAKAVELLNTLRSSRGILQDISPAATKDVIDGEIYKEYRKEFVSEGQLFFFYKRLGKTAIPGTSKVIDDKIYLLPYPINELEFGGRVQ